MRRMYKLPGNTKPRTVREKHIRTLDGNTKTTYRSYSSFNVGRTTSSATNSNNDEPRRAPIHHQHDHDVNIDNIDIVDGDIDAEDQQPAENDGMFIFHIYVRAKNHIHCK